MTCEKYVKDLAEILLSMDFVSNASIAFSGGLDSSIIAYLMKSLNPTLYTVGVENSVDIKNAIEISNILGLRLRIVKVTEEEIVEGIKFLKNIDSAISPVEIGFELPLYFLLKESDEEIIYVGQGADELFGGYKKYLDNPGLMYGDFERLIYVNVPREREIARRFDKRIVYPYLDDSIVRLGEAIPLECKIRNSVRKWVLRKAAEEMNMPEKIVEREKKAAQYGSGIWKTMVKMAKRRGYKISEFIEKI